MKKVLTLGVVITTILWTMGVAAFVPVASAATLSAGDLIKASGPAVYFYAADGKRYTFPTEATYKTWYGDFTGVKRITDDELAAIDLAGNIVARPGTKLVKITTVPKVFAVEPNGQLTWLATEAAAKALYGNDWAKKVIDVPDGFWVNYTNSGKSLDGTAYPAGQLIKYAGSPDVYRVNADGTKSLVTSAGMTANSFNAAFVVTAPAAIAMSNGAEISAKVATIADVSQGGGTGTVVPGTGTISVSLSAATPAANYVSKGVQNALFAKYNVVATGGNATVSKIVLQRKGLGFDADIDSVRLYDGATQVGTDQSLNTTTHQVTFNNLNWAVSGTKTLSVKANIAAGATGTNVYFELVQVVDSAGAISNVSVPGNAMLISAVAAGHLDVVAVAGTSTLISGATNQELGCWNLVADLTEGYYVDSIKLTNIGSASSVDAKNFRLEISSVVLTGSQVAAMASDNTVTFALTTPYTIAKSMTKKVCVYGDITAGITVSKTLRFQVAETKHFIARGDSSGGEVLITSAGSAAFTSESAKTNTIAQGTATLSQASAYAPADGTAFVKGVPSNKMAAYTLTAGTNEGIKLTKLIVTLEGTNVANTDFSSWSMYKIVDGAEVLVPVSGSVSGLTVTFEDSTSGLLDVPKSENKSFVIKGDVSTSAAGNETSVDIYVGANGTTNTLARIKGLESGDYITSGVTLSGVDTGDVQNFTIGSKGNLVVSKASDSPAANTYSAGATKIHFTTLNFYATGEDVTVTDLVLTAYEATGTGNAAEDADLTNMYITDEAGVQLGSTDSTLSSGEANFSFSYVVPKDTNKKIKVYADVPSAASPAGTEHIDMDTANTDITSTGVYSQATIVETGTCTGSDMTISAPTLVAAMGSNPVTTTYYVTSATGVTLGTLLLTAGTGQDIKVTSIRVSADDAADLNDVSTASANFSNIKLVDTLNPATQYGITQNLTDAAGAHSLDSAVYSGINNLTIAKGQTKSLTIVGDVVGSATKWYFGVHDASTEITATGLSSNTSATVTPNGSVVVNPGFTLIANGTLKVEKAADMPAGAQLVSGSTGNVLMKYKLTAGYEDIGITVLPLDFTGVLGNLSNVKLYLDGALLGNASGYQFTAATMSINFDTGVFVVKKAAPMILTIKGDLTSKDEVVTLAGAASGKTIGIGDSDGNATEWGGAGSYMITAKGVSSGATVPAANITSTGAAGGSVYGSNSFTFHKGILEISKNASSPSGTAVAGSNSEVLRLDLKAIGDDITVGELEFCVSGSATGVTGDGDVTLKSLDEMTTYATMTTAEYDAYWTGVIGAAVYLPLDPGVATGSCFSFGVTDGFGVTVGVAATNTTKAFTTAINIAAGTTTTVKLFGDTTGADTNKTLQVSVKVNPTAANKATVAGATYLDSVATVDTDAETTMVNLATTKNLPVTGGSLLY